MLLNTCIHTNKYFYVKRKYTINKIIKKEYNIQM